MTNPCEYCGFDLPLGIDKRTRQIRSRHFQACTSRPRNAQPLLTAPSEELGKFVAAAGYGYGWENLETSARRMAEHGVLEIARLEHNVGVLTGALWKACGDDAAVVNATIESQGGLL